MYGAAFEEAPENEADALKKDIELMEKDIELAKQRLAEIGRDRDE